MWPCSHSTAIFIALHWWWCTTGRTVCLAADTCPHTPPDRVAGSFLTPRLIGHVLFQVLESGSSVSKALAPGAFWQSAEKPFQCLAVCREIWLAHQTPDPSTYVCSLPIHSDGSCNGLQHFVAISRDHFGAKFVNMQQSTSDMVPEDAYSGVLNVVLQIVAADAAYVPLVAGGRPLGGRDGGVG